MWATDAEKFQKSILYCLLVIFSTSGTIIAQNISKARPLSPLINSRYEELAPVLSPDGNILYFCREGDSKNRGYHKRKDDQDIWVSYREADGNWGPPIHLNAPFNSESYDFPIYASADRETLYIGNVYLADGTVKPGVSKVRKQGNRWGWPQALEIENYYNNAGLVNYSMGADEKTLILNLQRNDTYGKMDIYVSFLKPNGTWSAPRNLGPKVNSGYNEVTPFLAADMKTLYFASNRPGGYGGFDMYVTRRLDDTWQNWSDPVNLGEEINSEGNDISYIIAPSGEYAIFSSDTPDNGKDLFMVILPEHVRPEASFIFSAVVIDEKNNPVEATVIIEDIKSRKTLYKMKSNPVNGELRLSLPFKNKFSLRVEKEGYLPYLGHLDLTDPNYYPEQNMTLQVKPVTKGASVQLSNLFFAYNSAALTEDSFAELERLKKILQENPKLKIEIGGHTDNIGSAQFNLNLSQKRAEAVRDYLITRGIAPNRIVAKGYGATKPIASNNTESGRAKNRRVVFTILEVQ